MKSVTQSRHFRLSAKHCRKSAAIAKNLQSIAENLQSDAENLQSVAENLQSAAENLQVLQKKKSAHAQPRGQRRWVGVAGTPNNTQKPTRAGFRTAGFERWLLRKQNGGERRPRHRGQPSADRRGQHQVQKSARFNGAPRVFRFS